MALLRGWLWLVAATILAMVVVGGATRLTEAGLSITQWKPISGVVPPLTAADWQAEFARYRAIPQYAQLFPDMDLSGFKAIFWWEWAHRLLGRVIGLLVAVPLAWFWLSGRLTRGLKVKLLLLLALGGVQGLIGWWMVTSGLSDRTEVAQDRLALHLLTASLTLALTIWIAETLEPPRAARSPAAPGLRAGASLMVAGIFLQLGLGALVAGLRAGKIYQTWPLMGDHWVPPGPELLFLTPAWRNIVDNAVTAQFNHRVVAYLLLGGALVHALHARATAPGTRTSRTAALLAGAVALQASIGVLTLVTGVPLGAALLHQFFAMIVLATAVTHRCGLRTPAVARGPADVTSEVIALPGFAPQAR